MKFYSGLVHSSGVKKMEKRTDRQSGGPLICKGLFFLILAYIICLNTVHATPLVIEKPGRYTPDPFVEIFEDSSAQMTFQDILKPKNQNQFKKSPKEKLNFGYSTSAFWLRLTIENAMTDGPDMFNLQVNFPNVHYIDFFSQKSNGGWQHTATGLMRAAQSRQVKTNRLLFLI